MGSPRKLLGWSLLAFAGVSGCGGGQDLGAFSRGLGGDIGNGYNTSLGSRYQSGNPSGTTTALRGTYARIETSFELDNLPGDPFDYEKVNVQVSVRKPDGGTVDVPAFFDGGKLWRMRHTPAAPGNYSVIAVKLNGKTVSEEKLEKKEWAVSGDTKPGFVRIDKGDTQRFVFDSGSRYYPLGHNQGWQSKDLPDIPTLFGKMHDVGENWSRVWMTHWDGKNLEWNQASKTNKPGTIDLETAKKWDSIVEAAEKQGIYFQMVVQHHGQYASSAGQKFSSNVNPNWDENPYNTKNGGFLANPEAFFTDPQARNLTKRKLYYMAARWGYSPNILAWELFNEVENTDAAKGKLWDDIAMWHREMALFLRRADGYGHLITTSANPGVALDSPIWETVDYLQTHGYTDDTAALAGTVPPEGSKKQNKPHFLGEFGSAEIGSEADEAALHNGVWASLMQSPSGAAQYWDWEGVEKKNLYGQYKAVSGFLAASALPNQGGLIALAVPVETSEKAALNIAPQGGWKEAKESEFIVSGEQIPAGLKGFPAYLQGESKREMMPKPLTLQLNVTQPGTVAVTIGKVAKAGGKLLLKVDGKATEREFAAGSADYTPKAESATASAELTPGMHTVSIENPGKDWLVLRRISIGNAVSALAARARIGKEYAAAWVYNRGNIGLGAKEKASDPVSGTLSLPGLKPGKYRATWWDTQEGVSLKSDEFEIKNAKDAAMLATPAIARDAALYVTKAGTPKVATKETKPKNSPKKTR